MNNTQEKYYWSNLPTGSGFLPWAMRTLVHRQNLDRILPAILHPQHRDDLIRLGVEREGGYVLTRGILDASDFLVTAGLGYEWSFEAAYATHKKVKYDQCCFHGYDPTILGDKDFAKVLGRVAWRRFFSKDHSTRYTLLSNHKEFFGGSPGKHFPLWVADKDSNDSVTINSAIDRALEAGGGSKILVKIDIEGAEYETLPTLTNTSKVAGLICEFHDINARLDEFLGIVEQLQQDFHLVHTHAVNCGKPRQLKLPDMFELTFEHKSLNDAGPKSKHSYPIAGLDVRAQWKKIDYSLEFEPE